MNRAAIVQGERSKPEKERQASPMNEIIDAQNFQSFGGSQSNILI
jgi:hypothetical protein